MSSKETILAALSATSAYISGEMLSQQCGISRTAVWKHIRRLQEEGYQIDSQKRLGYRLIGRDDVLSQAEISRRLQGAGWKVFHYDTMDSTSQEARRLILQGHGQGTLVVAESQTAGKGRLGRRWESPKGTGIWFSLILEPGIQLEQISQYSFVMAVSVAEGLQRATGLETQLKWPNDVLVNGRKVCGILLELVAEMLQVHQLIVGIGINANQSQEDFPADIQQKATSLRLALGHPVQRADVLCAVLEAVQQNCQLLEEQGFAAIREKWIALSCIIDQEVQVVQHGNVLLCGVARGLSQQGALLVETENGMEQITAGDVSLRNSQGGYRFDG